MQGSRRLTRRARLRRSNHEIRSFAHVLGRSLQPTKTLLCMQCRCTCKPVPVCRGRSWIGQIRKSGRFPFAKGCGFCGHLQSIHGGAAVSEPYMRTCRVQTRQMMRRGTKTAHCAWFACTSTYPLHPCMDVCLSFFSGHGCYEEMIFPCSDQTELHGLHGCKKVYNDRQDNNDLNDWQICFRCVNAFAVFGLPSVGGISACQVRVCVCTTVRAMMLN